MLVRVWVVALLCVFSTACKFNLQSSFHASSFNAAQDSSDAFSSKESRGMGISIDSPEEVGGAGDTVKVAVDNPENVRAIQVEIDGVDIGLISYLPHQFYMNPNSYDKDIVDIRVKASDHEGRLYVEERSVRINRISKGPVDGDCRQDAGYDACIFRKNPVAMNKAPIPGGISYGSDLSSVQHFGVRIEGMSDPRRLANNHIVVKVTNGTLAAPENGKWNFNYREDAGTHKISQVMAYYWLNEQIRFMTQRSGVFYASNRKMDIDAHISSLQDNARFVPARIEMGTWRGPSGLQETALSAEVYLHEMGHANLYYAMNQSMSGLSKTCASEQGCLGAIHEGQADIHAALMFPEDPRIAQSLENSMAGWRDRDVSINIRKSVADFFSAGSGQVHDLGAAYAAILWSIYLDSKMNKTDFMKIFSMHLSRIRPNSDFASAKIALMSISDSHFQGKYTSLIQKSFESRGVR